MPTIDVENFGPIEVASGTRLVLAIEDAGIDILHRCGGKSRCTTCRIEILEGDAGERTDREARRLALEDDITGNTRLSCQILADNDLRIRVINRLSETDMSDAGPRPDDEIPTV